jgi:hypothetical protein
MAVSAGATRVAAVLALIGSAGAVEVSPAHADAVGYLVNVTVRPGYHFRDADAALSYGYGLCERVREGIPYAKLLAGVKTDISTEDDYQAAYLINQAVNELCPAHIWQLRQSAAGYPGSPGAQSAMP